MTTKVNIVFRSAKDFDVTIDSIESLSPRGLELAWNAVNKQYRDMKGKMQARIRSEDLARETKKAEQEEKESAMRALEEEELKHLFSTAKENAIARFEEKQEEEKERLVASLASEKETNLRKAFIDKIEDDLREMSNKVARAKIGGKPSAEASVKKPAAKSDS